MTAICSSFRSRIRNVASVFGIVSLSVATTLLIQHFASPPHALAQSTEAQQVSKLELVSTDGTVLARLAPGAAGGGTLELFNASGGILTRIQTGGGGGGNVTLFDKDGNRRMVLAGEGSLNIFDPGGALRFRSGNTITQTQIGPPFNGIQLDGEGTIDYIPAGGFANPR